MQSRRLLWQILMSFWLVVVVSLLAVTGYTYNQNLTVFSNILGVSLGVAVMAGVLGVVLAKRITAPLEDMREAAARFAAGQFDEKIPAYSSHELAQLADTMNSMADEINKTLKLVNEQKNQLSAVLKSMAEGVIAISHTDKILNINDAAGRILGLNAAEAQGGRIHEVIRHAALLRFVNRLRCAEADGLEERVVLYGPKEVHLLVHGSRLSGYEGEEIGLLIVLHDVSEIHRLEQIRQDFVANVSHELKTPITSIKGFMETLLDGVYEEPKQARGFMEIIQKQADRLDLIITDLLALSRLEEQQEIGQSIALEPALVRDIITDAVHVCEKAASDKHIHIEWSCENDLRGRVNMPLIEQALVNLIDNAVKYSEPEKTVHITAGKENEGLFIKVKDEGFGIEKDHIPRLFERFYRVDKARSRKLGGTGLGLAIVKHIVKVHHGYVHVISAPGEGSVFVIHIPSFT